MSALELKTHNYKEAVRYYENAKEILKTKARKEERFYQDPKYVRMACGTAYNGVLLALDTYLLLKDRPIIKKKTQCKSVEDYRTTLSVLDKKLLNDYNIVYEILHLDGYYDGVSKVDIIKSGMESAAIIINKIKPTGWAALKK